MGAEKAMNLFRLKTWWEFRRRSTTRHGVHSPFVYRFLDEWLRHKHKGSLMDRCTGFFESERLNWLILEPGAFKTSEAFAQYKADLQRGTILVIKDIHKTDQALARWRQCCEDKRINLSIELWQVGLLCYRENFKERQHFALRCPL